MKIQHTLLAALGCLCLLTTALPAQVPNLLNYQGRVAVGGVNFEGEGRFKFALVANRNSVQATATAVVINGTVSLITFTNVGAGYPGGFIPISITGGGGVGASAGAAASGSDGSLHLVFLNGGTGYTSAPTVAINPPPTPNFVASFWSHDGFSYLGAEPTTEVRLPVVKGLYSVLLGDTSVTGMTQPIPASVWTNPDVRLRVWFNDGTNGFQLLTPDQRIAPSGYLPDGTVTAAKLADGSVSSTKLASGAAAANLSANGQSGVASGGIVLSTADNAALIAAGYVKVIGGAIPISDAWPQRANATTLVGRKLHTAIWTGGEMIVWGGYDGASYLNNGGRFNPAANTWKTVTITGAPAARIGHTVVWTGNKMIVWGGYDGASYLDDGAAYDPQTKSWSPLSKSGTPAGRRNHTAVWTGSEMIVWGGRLNTTLLADGARYNPSDDTWHALTNASPPTARELHTAVWTGSEMIVFGGRAASGPEASGGRYDSATDVWKGIHLFDVETRDNARQEHTAVWTGSEMIVWGGLTNPPRYASRGGRYDPLSDTWTGTGTTETLSRRRSHTAVWTGNEMIIWGGVNDDSSSVFNDGARFDPASGVWQSLTNSAAPGARESHTAVWTGGEMIVWGGLGASGYFNDTFSYTPGRMLYLYQRP